MLRYSSPTKISDTWLGKLIVILLIFAYFLFLTDGTTQVWYAQFLPSLPVILACLLFVIAIIRGAKLPKFKMLSWVTLAGAGYFFVRAWLSPARYDGWGDMSLIACGGVFYVLGLLSGISQKKDRLLFGVIGLSLISGVILLIWQQTIDPDATIVRQLNSVLFRRSQNVSFFSYKNFAAHFLLVGGFFSVSYALVRGFAGWGFGLIGIVAIIASFFCSSRGVYPNMCIGMLVCWMTYLFKIQDSGKKFTILSIASLVALLFVVLSALLAISQNSQILQTLSSFWVGGGRFQLPSIAVGFALQEPFFGNGSSSFCDLATPFTCYHGLPNMAHNEYAQSMCDYGFIGFGILAILLLWHICRGFKLIASSNICSGIERARVSAALVLLLIATVHASMEFIWHTPALVIMGAFCAGIISSGSAKQQRAGKMCNNAALVIVGLIVAGFYTMLARNSASVWCIARQVGAIEHRAQHRDEINAKVKEAITKSYDPEITIAYSATIINKGNSRTSLALMNEQEFCIDALNKALKNAPSRVMAKTYLGVLLSQRGRFAEADVILEPFTRKNYVFLLYRWRSRYILHLERWSNSIFFTNPNMALSLINEAIYRSSSSIHTHPMSAQGIKKLTNRLRTQQFILEEQGATPDDSWKERHLVEPPPPQPWPTTSV